MDIRFGLYKTPLHDLVWFPYRPEHPFIGPTLAVLVVIAATGSVKVVDVLSSNFLVPGAVISVPGSIAFGLASYFMCIRYSSVDYFSTRVSVLPCLITTLFLYASIFIAGRFVSMSGTLNMGGAVFASVMFVGRLVQSGGSNLGELGAQRRTIRLQASRLKRLENSAFAEERQHFTATLKEFIKALKKVLPELTYTNNASKFLTHATIFLDNATRSERSDFLEDLLRSPAALIRPLDNVDRRVEGE